MQPYGPMSRMKQAACRLPILTSNAELRYVRAVSQALRNVCRTQGSLTVSCLRSAKSKYCACCVRHQFLKQAFSEKPQGSCLRVEISFDDLFSLDIILLRSCDAVESNEAYDTRSGTAGLTLERRRDHRERWIEIKIMEGDSHLSSIKSVVVPYRPASPGLYTLHLDQHIAKQHRVSLYLIIPSSPSKII